jgi:hypothetical protein
MKKILTIVLILAAAIGGGFGGMALKPQNEEMEAGEASEAALRRPRKFRQNRRPDRRTMSMSSSAGSSSCPSSRARK